MLRPLYALFFASILTATSVNCGSDDPGGDGDNGGTPDASSSDAAADPDAPEGPAFSGLLALTDVRLSNPPLVALGFSGAQVQVAFTDNSTVTVPPLEGYDNPVGGCAITVYDIAAGQTGGTGVDGGPVSVTGTNAGDFSCAFADDSYRCALDDAASSGVVPEGSTASLNVPMGYAQYTISGADFSGINAAGTYVVITGFEDENANGTFPVLGDNDGDTLLVANPAAPVLATSVPAGMSGTYATIVGAGPVPGGFDFLDDGTNDVTITKAEMGQIPAINQTIKANGSGMVLEGTQPHEMATDGTPVTFTCGSSPDSCGPTGGGVLNGMTLSGSTTDADVTGLLPNAMPAPVNRRVSFSCSALGQTSATLDAGAMEAILGLSSGSPTTRIQMSVSYVAGSVVGSTNLVVGHNVTGWTDVE